MFFSKPKTKDSKQRSPFYLKNLKKNYGMLSVPFSNILTLKVLLYIENIFEY